MCVRLNFKKGVGLKRNGTDFKEFEGNTTDWQWLPSYHGQPLLLPAFFPPRRRQMKCGKERSDDGWGTKREELRVEHFLPRAPEDLRVEWKAWLAENGAGADNGTGGVAIVVSAAGVTPRARD